MNFTLNDWAKSVLADPIKKTPKDYEEFVKTNGIVDARVTLKNSIGFSDWNSGQSAFEDIEVSKYFVKKRAYNFQVEIQNDKVIYDQIPFAEPILDIGGSCGLLREFLNKDDKYLVIDPFIDVFEKISVQRKSAYKCLLSPLNFIAGHAEFLPLQSQTFKTVHMRSMLDHVHIVDLCLLEAKRVLRSDGNLIIGITIEGKPYGVTGRELNLKYITKKIAKQSFSLIGFSRFRDKHVWHPTYDNLIKVVEDAGFKITKTLWQPCWKGRVVYILAKPRY